MWYSGIHGYVQIVYHRVNVQERDDMFKCLFFITRATFSVYATTILIHERSLA